MTDMSWKSHLATLRKKNRMKSGDAATSASETGEESRAMIGVVSPETPLVSPDVKQELRDADDEAIGEDGEDALSLRDSYLQRRILEITSSTSWLSASMDDEQVRSSSQAGVKESFKKVVSPADEEDRRVGRVGRPSDETHEKDIFEFQIQPQEDPSTPTRKTGDRYQPVQSESPSTHMSASTASKKASITLPSEKAIGRISISPGREKKDSEFARRLKLNGNFKDDDGDGSDGRRQHQQQQDEEKQERNTKIAGDTKKIAEVEDVWKTALTSDGRMYYYNRRTRMSSWKLPDGATLANPSQPSRHDRLTQSAASRETTETTETTNAFGLFCMFCGTNLSGHGSSLDKHLDTCLKFDIKSSDAISAVCILASKMGIMSGAGFSILESQQSRSQASQSSSVRYEDSFDSFDERASDGKERCEYCSRTFAKGRLAHHERACRDSHAFKKVPYDSGRKRVQGTQLEFHVRSPSAFDKPHPARSGSKPTTPSDRSRRVGT